MKYLLTFSLLFLLVISVPLYSSAETSIDHIYTIGPNDVIDIKVLDHNDLRTTATVSSDGAITFPYIGTVMVKGMSLSEIEETITKKLSEGYIQYPVVTVSLVRSLSKKIFAYGEVNRRGQISLEENITVLKALSIVGGVTVNGMYGILKIRREMDIGKGNYEDIAATEIKDGIIEDKRVENMLLESDDVIIVERNKTFLVQGEVMKRGRFDLEKDMTVLRALLQAGGVTEYGLYGVVKVRRKQAGEAGEYKTILESRLNEGVIESKEAEEFALESDDVLVVERNRTFLVQGEVMKRGRFDLEKDMTVLRALLQAGGVTRDGLYGVIKIRRKQANNYEDLAEAKLRQGVIESRDVEDIVIMPDDILIIEPNLTFFIYGEVNKTGEFVLQSDMTVFQAITIAGGFTKWGSENKVKVLRQQSGSSGFTQIKVDVGDIIKGDASKDILLEDDDKIIVSSGVF